MKIFKIVFFSLINPLAAGIACEAALHKGYTVEASIFAATMLIMLHMNMQASK